MMVCSVGSPIWLCWIVLLVTPLVQCQFGNNPFSSNSFGGGSGKNGVGNAFPNGNGNGGFQGGGGGFQGGGFQKGGFNGGFNPGFRPNQGQQFGSNGQAKGSGEEQQQEDATPKETQVSEIAQSTSGAESTGEAAPSSTVAEAVEEPEQTAAANDEMALVQPETSSSTAPAPAVGTPLTPKVEQPTSTSAIAVFTTSAATAPIAAPVSSNTAYNGLLTTSAPALQPATSASATSTVTTSEIVVVTPSPVQDPEPESAIPDSEPEPTAPASPTSAVGEAPLSESSGPTMSASARAGMGVGVTFGIISIAGMAGFYLWRRRQNQRFDRDSTGGGLGGFFMLNRKSSKTDAEWEVGNAEKVEIVRGASARTVSRSDSSRKPSRDGGSSEEGEKIGLSILKVGMRVPDRPNPALTSNPPMPSPSQFPSPPSSRGTMGSLNEKEKKTSSWPLPD